MDYKVIPTIESIPVRHLARKDFTWDDLDLMFQKRVVCTLIPHKTIPTHWHLKFEWRDEPTPEFFNIFNARENARTYCAQHVQESLQGEPVEAFK